MKHFLLCLAFAMTATASADDFDFKLRRQTQAASDQSFERKIESETWPADRTAFIVCDVWDRHHSINAVRRLEEFGPRLNSVLKEARGRGAIIIHSPSDCMAAYEGHPARVRAQSAPKANNAPSQVAQWCSRIPAEEVASYPIDQSDGGDDDDPADHARWAAELTAEGRDAALPWKAQSTMIEIDEQLDYISDRGDEVWNVLEDRGIEHVVLTGVHTNMCVLGRPFGLRRMVAGGRQVVLMRDLTDCMYNPARWPFVDHFTGNDLVVSHIERFVCPTITSDQVLGGEPFRFSHDTREQSEAMVATSSSPDADTLGEYWHSIALPTTWSEFTKGAVSNHAGASWYRCTLRLNADRASSVAVFVSVVAPADGRAQAWLNGVELKGTQGLCLACSRPEPVRFAVPLDLITMNEANLLALRIEARSAEKSLIEVPSLVLGEEIVPISCRWQVRTDDDPQHANMPLPAKFGSATDIVFEP